MIYIKYVVEAINEILEHKVKGIEQYIKVCQHKNNGDYSISVASLAKVLNKDSRYFYEKFNNSIKSEKFESIQWNNGYINFYVNKDTYIKDLSSYILCKKNQYGFNSNLNENILFIDYDILNKKENNFNGIYKSIFNNIYVNLLTANGKNVIVYKEYRNPYKNEENKFEIQLKSANMSPFIIIYKEKNVTKEYKIITDIIKKFEKDKINKVLCIGSINGGYKLKQMNEVLKIMDFEHIEKCSFNILPLVKFNGMAFKNIDINNINIDKIEKVIENNIINILDMEEYRILKQCDDFKRIIKGIMVFEFIKKEKKEQVSLDFTPKGIINNKFIYVYKIILKIKKIINIINEEVVDRDVTELEFNVARSLEQFPQIINESVENIEPCYIVEYIISICTNVEKLLDNKGILDITSLYILKSSIIILENGLNKLLI